MATLKCLACGHDNNVGDESCSSCSSSLNLRLCSVCEAINANSAERCHSCKAEFRPEQETATLLEVDAPAGGGLAQEAPPPAMYLPAAWRVAAERARKRGTKFAAALWLVSVLAAGLGSYFYAVSRADQRPEAAPGPAVKRELAPTPPSEPKRTTGAVTHTRAAGADAPAKTTAVTLPVVAAPAATAPAAAAPAAATAASAPVLPPSQPPASTPVTHTKAVPTETAAAAAAPTAAAEGRTAPAETRSDEPAGCTPAVAALGLCKSK